MLLFLICNCVFLIHLCFKIFQKLQLYSIKQTLCPCWHTVIGLTATGQIFWQLTQGAVSTLKASINVSRTRQIARRRLELVRASPAALYLSVFRINQSRPMWEWPTGIVTILGYDQNTADRPHTSCLSSAFYVNATLQSHFTTLWCIVFNLILSNCFVLFTTWVPNWKQLELFCSTLTCHSQELTNSSWLEFISLFIFLLYGLLHLRDWTFYLDIAPALTNQSGKPLSDQFRR